MDQGKFQEPENPKEYPALSQGADRVWTMSIQEHAALVQVIMLNFPEIYEEQAGANFVLQAGERGSAKRSIQRPATV